MSDANTPVLVGIAQVQQREQDYTIAQEPLALMLEAIRLAAEDAGAPALVDKATSVRVIRGIWPYKDPGRALATELGIASAESCLSQFGGNFVQTTVNEACLDIQAERHRVILITGAECGYTQARARKAGTRPDWQKCPGTPDRRIGADVSMSSEFEQARQLQQPIQVYPMFETALRHARGEDLQAHMRRVSELWAGFSRVASTNPNAWLREAVSAEDIRTVSATNRPVSYPYPKLMNSNNSVDMGAALILTNVATARSLGVPEDRWIYPHVGTDGHDKYNFSARNALHESPAIRIAGQRALELAEMSVADVDHVDVYSCFPVAVQVGATEIGLPLDRDLTVTGGLTFNGGPLNNYVMHSIARMAEILRARPGERGLVTANGGFLTKHAFGVYSTEPPAKPFQHEDCQAQIDALPTRSVDTTFTGDATIESCVVMFGADGPANAWTTLLTPAGDRTIGVTREASIMQAMTEEEFVGRAARIDSEGNLTVA